MALAYDDDISLLTLEGEERPDSQSPATKAKIETINPTPGFNKTAFFDELAENVSAIRPSNLRL
jgi:hypothetical protein